MEKQRNPVAKNARKFNKASVQRDKKKDQKRGYKVKHKNKLYASTTPPVGEGLKVSDGMPAWIKDFQKSDAPQFQGKSDEKRKQMAVAAYMDAKGGSMKEDYDNPLSDYPEQGKMKISFTVKKEDAIARAKETARLKQKHDAERKAEKAAAKRITNPRESTIGEGDLPPHLSKFFDKKGHPKPAVAKRMAAGDKKRASSTSKDVTPKGYGPKESIGEETKGTYRVEIQGLPVMYIDASSVGGVKQDIRKMLRNPKDLLDIRRVPEADKKKDFRSRITGKDSEVEEGFGKMSDASKNLGRLRKAAGVKVDKQTTTKTKGGSIVRKTTYKKVNELSNTTLSSYKTKAAKQASAADKAGNFKKADKRFSGITKATNKQFANDAKKHESVEEALTPIEKRKHMNLKRRIKKGDNSAKKQLADFEKKHAADLKMAKGSSANVMTKSNPESDNNIVVQLRKAQDQNGNHNIEVGNGKTIKLGKSTIDALLKQHDSLKKPDQKSKWAKAAQSKLKSRAK